MYIVSTFTITLHKTSTLHYIRLTAWGSSGISWIIYKLSALHSRQITMPVPHHSVFTDQMPFLPPNQQQQSTEDTLYTKIL